MPEPKQIVKTVNETLRWSESVNKALIKLTKPNGQSYKIEAQIEPDKIITDINSGVSIGDMARDIAISAPVEQIVPNPNNPTQVIIIKNNSGNITFTNQKKSILDDAMPLLKKLIERWF